MSAARIPTCTLDCTPSSAGYLCPRDYYRGAPAELLVQPEAKLRAATERRRRYWEEHRR
jgi:hypothetical protein